MGCSIVDSNMLKGDAGMLKGVFWGAKYVMQKCYREIRGMLNGGLNGLDRGFGQMSPAQHKLGCFMKVYNHGDFYLWILKRGIFYFFCGS